MSAIAAPITETVRLSSALTESAYLTLPSRKRSVSGYRNVPLAIRRATVRQGSAGGILRYVCSTRTSPW